MRDNNPESDRPINDVRVVHFGVAGETPGGIKSVMESYLAESDSLGVTSSVVVTSTGYRKPTQIIRWLFSVVRIGGMALDFRLRHRDIIATIHLSHHGSFIREGSLVAAARLARLPVIAHLHGSTFPDFATKFPRLCRGVLSQADVVLVLSNQMADVVTALGIPKSSVLEVPNWVRPSDAAVEDREPIVLFGGEVSHRKGSDVLADAWRMVDVPGARLRVAGPWTGEVGRQLAATPKVEMLGSITRAQLRTEQERAAVSVLPSRAEGLPMFLLESMVCGSAVIATPVGGIESLLSDGCGEVVPVGDARRLAAAIDRLLTDRYARLKMAERARARVASSYGPAIVRQRLVPVWLELIANHRTRARQTWSRR